MTRALITGMTGFVGSHLADYLMQNTDWLIYGMIRWRSPLDNIAELLPYANRGERVNFVYADLRDDRSVRDAVRQAAPDYVFHLAAQSYPQTSYSAPYDTIETNAQGTARVLEAVREYAPDAWVHVCSSCEVYGVVPVERIPINEDCPFHPASPYAISKVGADLIARHYAQAYGMRILTTRMFTHTGPRRGDVFAESSFAKQVAMIEAGQLRPVIRHGNLDSTRTLADVRDAVRAYYMLLTVNPKPGAVYNIGGNYSCTVGNILQTLAAMQNREFGSDPVLFEQEAIRMRPIDANNQVPDCRKFKEATGWEPTISFQQTMHDLLQYWRNRIKRGNFLQR